MIIIMIKPYKLSVNFTREWIVVRSYLIIIFACRDIKYVGYVFQAGVMLYIIYTPIYTYIM